MSRYGLAHLWQALRFDRREIFQLDFYLALLAARVGLPLRSSPRRHYYEASPLTLFC